MGRYIVCIHFPQRSRIQNARDVTKMIVLDNSLNGAGFDMIA